MKRLVDMADGDRVEMTTTGNRGAVSGRMRGLVWVLMESKTPAFHREFVTADGRRVEINGKAKPVRVPIYEQAQCRKIRRNRKGGSSG